MRATNKFTKREGEKGKRKKEKKGKGKGKGKGRDQVLRDKIQIVKPKQKVTMR